MNIEQLRNSIIDTCGACLLTDDQLTFAIDHTETPEEAYDLAVSMMEGEDKTNYVEPTEDGVELYDRLRDKHDLPDIRETDWYGDEHGNALDAEYEAGLQNADQPNVAPIPTVDVPEGFDWFDS